MDAKTKQSIANAVAQWNSAVPSCKWTHEESNPKAVLFKLGKENDSNYLGYTPDTEQWIQLKSDHRGDQGLYPVDILYCMGYIAGLG